MLHAISTEMWTSVQAEIVANIFEVINKFCKKSVDQNVLEPSLLNYYLHLLALLPI